MHPISSTDLDRERTGLEPVKHENSSDKINAFVEQILEGSSTEFNEGAFSQSKPVFGGDFTNEQFFEI